MMPLIARLGYRSTMLWRTFSISSVHLAEMHDPMEHATGAERKELEAMKAGNKDPWGIQVIIKRAGETLDKATEIPSAFCGRIVGCACKNHRFVVWMWLEEGCPKRCECGYWFKIKKIKPFLAK